MVEVTTVDFKRTDLPLLSLWSIVKPPTFLVSVTGDTKVGNVTLPASVLSLSLQ